MERDLHRFQVWLTSELEIEYHRSREGLQNPRFTRVVRADASLHDARHESDNPGL